MLNGFPALMVVFSFLWWFSQVGGGVVVVFSGWRWFYGGFLRKGQDRKGSHPTPPTHSMRSKAEGAGALDELVKRRRDAARGGSGGRYSPIKRRSFATTTFNSPSRSGSGSHNDEGDSTVDGGMADSDDEKTSKSKMPMFEDIKEITIRRSKLAKWFVEPFFDELIVGCFVMVGIGKSRSGPIYRLCMVRNVDATEPNWQYKLGGIASNPRERFKCDSAGRNEQKEQA
ncbi:Protein RTF1-like protein [Abeliophyllum distichum]|uniref:Protein RTF1-like protein n=1 Tax=Abeliophyllum distichum TaxID=126358 RepID=A0ABD1R2A4_9LAMI